MTQRLSGKIALITGGSSGIGLATAKRFSEQGATVIITGRQQDKLDAALKSLGQNSEAIKSDVAQMADIDYLMATIKAKFGHIDILFANAGVARFAPVEQSEEAMFDELVATNIKGLFFSVQKALPLLKDGSSIILNSSTVSQLGLATTSVYSATKAAVRSLARTLSADLLERNIRVNAVAPGPIDTPIFEKIGIPHDAIEGAKSHFAGMVPMKRLGNAEEIANVVTFLASSESSYVLGEELVAGGGMTRL